MKRIVGYTLFCLGIGMLLAIIIPFKFFSVLISALILLIGYNLFCC